MRNEKGIGAMVNGSGASTASKRRRWALRIGYAAWALYAGILCFMGVLIALLRFRGERMPRWTRLGAVGLACATRNDKEHIELE